AGLGRPAGPEPPWPRASVAGAGRPAEHLAVADGGAAGGAVGPRHAREVEGGVEREERGAPAVGVQRLGRVEARAVVGAVGDVAEGVEAGGEGERGLGLAVLRGAAGGAGVLVAHRPHLLGRAAAGPL